jgi:hypothetical protein
LFRLIKWNERRTLSIHNPVRGGELTSSPSIDTQRVCPMNSEFKNRGDNGKSRTNSSDSSLGGQAAGKTTGKRKRKRTMPCS